MTEYIAQMAPMLLLAGVAAGWAGEAISRVHGYGFMYDLALGIVGSLIAGILMSLVIANGGGMVAMFVVGCAGATLVIAAQRQFWRSARPGA
jgi:uncharacterized membrane protein YeaQ/YmgE (transglycosylase-associated protein family)